MPAKESIIKELSEACFNPNYLVKRLNRVLFRDAQRTSGRIHFHFQNKSDHIILIWFKGRLKDIVVKSPDCKQSESVKWNDSQFFNYQPENVLEQLYQQIVQIEIDEHNFRKRWLAYDEFIKWLIKS
ncbi:MAG: hypothetical protein ABIE75_05165 [Candidatus Omnitrophota bacterium]